jgi:hypothetical protein
MSSLHLLWQLLLPLPRWALALSCGCSCSCRLLCGHRRIVQRIPPAAAACDPATLPPKA